MRGTSRASSAWAALDRRAGPISAVHTSRLTFFRPASANGGTSGASRLRPPVKPMALSLPERMCGRAMPGGISAIWIWPPSMAVTTCGLPEYGTCTGVMPDERSLISSMPKCPTDPLPTDP